MSNYFETLLKDRYEGLHFVSDAKTGLRGFIGIHSTKLGPALGGTRALATYRSEEEAATDVLRLSKAMTYKAALAGLPHGGGKCVVWLPSGSFDRAKLFEALGRAIDGLAGRYISTEDSGTSPADMASIRRATKHVVGLEGASGDPSPVTAFGVARAMEAVSKHLFGSPDLAGRRITVLGVGHVGLALVSELQKRKAKIFVTDIDPKRSERAVKEFRATALSEDELLRMEADFFAPCALGSALNDRTIPLLRVKAVVGAANNQLAEPRHGKELADRGIVYGPDYAVNAGGLINVAQEVAGYDRAKALGRADRIFDTIDQLLARSKESGRRPEEVADQMVEEKLYG